MARLERNRSADTRAQTAKEAIAHVLVKCEFWWQLHEQGAELIAEPVLATKRSSSAPQLASRASWVIVFGTFTEKRKLAGVQRAHRS